MTRKPQIAKHQLPELDRSFDRWTHLKKFVREHGEKGKSYTHIVKEKGRFHTDHVTALRQVEYCPVCHCVNEDRTVVVQTVMPSPHYANGTRHLKVDPGDCANPACQAYHSFMNEPEPVRFDRCSKRGCSRTAKKGEACPTCGGPDFDVDITSFDHWAFDRGIRVSVYPEIRFLTFLKNDQTFWLIDDTRDPPIVPEKVRDGVLTKREREAREKVGV